MALERRIEVVKTARFFCTSEEFHLAEDVWVVLHGYGQLASRFLSRFEELGTQKRIFIAPEGFHRFYTDDNHSKVGASWMSRESRETDIEDNLRFLDQIIGELMLPLTAKIHLLGFSQGAATAVRWFCASKLGFTSLTLWAGSFPPDVSLSFYSEKFRSLKVLLVAGENDRIVPQQAMREVLRQLEKEGVAANMFEHKGVHEVRSSDLSRVIKLVESNRKS